MISYSIKQLLRRPGKAILFLLLMAASTALVVTGSIMSIENTRRIRIVEDRYTTIGTVEQMPLSTESHIQADPCFGTFSYTNSKFGSIISVDTLNVSELQYVYPPEYRPYFISYLPEFHHSGGAAIRRHILEFTPTTDSADGEPVEVQVTKVLQSDIDSRSANAMEGCTDQSFHEGDIFTLCQHSTSYLYPLKAGERYVSCVGLSGICPTHNEVEYVTYLGPYSDQRDTQGNLIDSGAFPDDIEAYQSANAMRRRVHRVTGGDFYDEGRPGANYLKWAEIYRMEDNLFVTVATNSLSLLPSYHNGTILLTEGREITAEEFEQGAAVCMVPQELAQINQLSVGSTMNLPFLCAIYGNISGKPTDFSLLKADGEFFQPFFEQEYEIVGIYAGGHGTEDILDDMLIVPVTSVKAAWDESIAGFNPMSKGTVSFQIPNGSIQEFDATLKTLVPESEKLNITYDDRGYSEIIKSLKASRNMAALLLLIGILAVLAIIALLLYFFVVKEKKHTAIERSLGMSKHQCRVSLLTGIMVLTIIATAVGSLSGALILNHAQKSPATVVREDKSDQYTYSTEYSMWAANREIAGNTEIQVERPINLYFVVPICLLLMVLTGSDLLLEHNFTIDPIYLLGAKGKL